jgi:phytoene desaturase
MPLQAKDGNQQVIIVGAGIGGITTSAFLAKKGFKVKVFEKNSFPSGRCGQIIRDGHRFDMGATLLLMPGIYRMVFDSLGLNLEDFLSAKPLDPIYRIYFGNKGTLDFSNNRQKMRMRLEDIEKGSGKNFDRFVDIAYGFYQASLKQLLGVNFYSVQNFFNIKNLILFLKIKIHLRYYSYLNRFFKHPFLKQAFSFQNIYLGQNPFTSPALFTMIPAAECTEGALFPEGGLSAIPGKLFEYAKGLGVEFYFNTTVKNLVVENKQINSIVLTDGTKHSADLFVINADLPYAYRELLPDKRKAIKINRKQHASSAMVIHWALKKHYPQLAHHSVFLSTDYKESIQKIFKEKSISPEPSFYLHAPVKTDPSAAPEGQDSISAVIPAGHVDGKYKQDWESLYKQARISVIKRLAEVGLTDFEENIKFEIWFSPADWEKTCNVSRGSVFGSLSHSILQMGYFRPHNKHDKYANLYFAGGSTHPGNGVPLVLLSSKLTSERIIKENT